MTPQGETIEGRGAVSFETAFARPIATTPDDFDQLGHVNNAVYLRWAQEIAVRHWTIVAPPAVQAKYLFVVLRHEVDYRDPILPGDEVIARTWLGKASGPRFERYVDIRKTIDGVDARRPSAQVLSVWCMLDIGTRRPRRINEEILAAFAVSG